MAPNRRELLKSVTSLGCVGFGVAFAGCSGQQPGTSPTETSAGVVTVESHTVYGTILADVNGRTLYMFARDSQGESVCTGGCAETWPPLTVETEDEAVAGSEVSVGLGTTEREDGSLQVTANEMPLYLFAGDDNPGDANGMGVINAWFLLRPDGSVLKPTVSVATHDSLGEILTDADGRTLYRFTNDSAGESSCAGDCASVWPPLTVMNEGAVVPAATIDTTLGTVERDDGSLQVTAEDMPLYYYAQDEEAGDAKGQGVGDAWYVVRPDGSLVMTRASPTPTPTETGGGGGLY